MTEEKLGPDIVPIHVFSSDPGKAALRMAVLMKETLARIAAEAPGGEAAAAAIRAVTLEATECEHSAYSDAALADALVSRLNRLIADPAVRADITTLLTVRIGCSEATANHASIQARDSMTGPTIAFLGVLNGIVGVRSNGSGHIAAIFEDRDGDRLLGEQLLQFDRLLDPPEAEAVVDEQAGEPPRGEIA